MPKADFNPKRYCFHLLLTAAGGWMDAYSYTVRGQVFATLQTGNLALMTMGLARMDLAGAMQYAIPIGLYLLGIIVSLHIMHKYSCNATWERRILLLEAVVFLLVGFLPLTLPNVLVNGLISFAAALQLSGFRTMGNQFPFSSVFCTVNMRSCAESFYYGIVNREKASIAKGCMYLGILLAFCGGICLGLLGARLLNQYAVWGIDLILLFCLFLNQNGK